MNKFHEISRESGTECVTRVWTVLLGVNLMGENRYSKKKKIVQY
jgi:hypothetical protein